MIDIVHYFSLANNNILTKKKGNLHAIVGLKEFGSPIEIKDLTVESLSKGKLHDMDGVWSMADNSDVLSICSLRHQNATFHSFAFCLLEALEILMEIHPSN